MDDSGSLSFHGLICPNCFARNRLSANYCDNCGRLLQQACTACGNKNRPGANYCDNCGRSLESGSPLGKEKAEADSAPRRPEAPAQASQPAAKAAEVQGLSQHIPKEFAEKLENAISQKAMVGERRIVTFLFCDMQGSTAAAGEMDPEEWAEIVNEVFEIMIRPVYTYEGIVARLMGDAILAFFGAPIAHEDDPQRAILAGLEIVQRIEAYRESLKGRRGIELNLRVGINTGLVMVGQVGSDLQMEYTALGDAINVAARMEQTAQPGTVQVAEDTYRLAAPLFEFEEIGAIEVKGKPEPVHAYRPLAVKAQPGSLRGIEGLKAPLVGRDGEYGLLFSAFQNLQRGVGKVVFLVGEAGLGKSRLIREVKERSKRLKTEDESATSPVEVSWYEAASLSFETAKPYGLFQHTFRCLWEIGANDTPEEIREKITQVLKKYPFGDQSQVQTACEVLLGLQPERGSTDLEGESLKRLLFKVVQEVWLYETAEKPAVLVLDDLHWADPASVELLLDLVQLTDQAPLLVICATRFDPDSPGWRVRQVLETRYPHRFVEINLRPLTSSESDALVNKLLDRVEMPDRLRSRILEKTEGNPFFIEEVIRVLIERGVLKPEVEPASSPDAIRWRVLEKAGGTNAGNFDGIDIPENLLALLVARIDRLEEHARHTLQLASVIGRSFYYRILEAIEKPYSTAQEELKGQLLILQQAELIREEARIPELEYVFRHSLTQEATYETILLKQRREFHSRVGEAIEQLFSNRLEEFYPILGHHFGEAGDPRALKYTLLSGDSAFRLYAIPEAQVHYDKALEIAKRPEMEISSDTWIHLYTRRGRVYELQSRYPEALEIYAEMENLARQNNDARMLLPALLAQATVLAIPNPVWDPARAKSFSEQALTLARELGDHKVEAKILWNFLILKNYSGKMREGIPYGEQSVALARTHQLAEQLAYSLQDMSLPYMGIGDLDASRRVLDEAHGLWEELGNIPMLVENLSNSCLHRILTGQFEEAIAFAEEALRTGRKIDNEWGQTNSQIFIGFAYQVRGEMDRAIQVLEWVIPVAQRIGHPGSILCQHQLASIYQHLGDLDRALDLAGQALQEAGSFPPFRVIALAGLAKLELEAGNLAEADRRIQESIQAGFEETLLIIDISKELTHIEILLAQEKYPEAGGNLEALLDKLHKSGARYFLPAALFQQARWLEAQGQAVEACVVLQEARTVAEQMGARTVLWKILADLSRLEAMQGEMGKAEMLGQQAREIVRFIADHTPEPEMKENFYRLTEAVLVLPQAPG